MAAHIHTRHSRTSQTRTALHCANACDYTLSRNPLLPCCAPAPTRTGDTINVVPGQSLIRGETLASTYLSFVPAPQPLPITPGLEATFFLSPSLLYVTLPSPATLALDTNCNSSFTLFNVNANTEKTSPFTNCSLSEDGLGVTLYLPGTAGEATDSIDVSPNQTALTVGTIAVQPRPGPRTRVTSVYLDTAFLIAPATVRLRFTQPMHLPANLTAAECNSIFGIYTAASTTPKSDAFASCFQPNADDASIIHLTLAAGTAFESGDRVNVIDNQRLMRLHNPAGPFIPAQQRYTDTVPVMMSAIATSPTTVIVTLPLNSTLTSGCNVNIMGKPTTCSISSDDPTKLTLRTGAYEANDKVYINTNAPSLSYGSTRYGRLTDVDIQPSIWSARLTGPNTLAVSLAGLATLPANATCSSILSLTHKPDAISTCSLASATLYATLSPTYTYSPTDTINIVAGQSSLTTPAVLSNTNPTLSFVPNPAGPLAILPSVTAAVLLDADVTHGSFTLVVTLPLGSSIFTPGSNPAPAATLPSCADIFTLSSISGVTVTSCSSSNPNGPSTTLTVTASGAYNASGFLNIATTNGAGSGAATLASLRTGASASTGVLYAPLTNPTPLLPSLPASAIATTPTTILVTLPFTSTLRNAAATQQPALNASYCASIFSIPTKTILSCELDQRTLHILLDPATPYTPGDTLSLTPTHGSPNQPSVCAGNLVYAPRPNNSTTTIRPTITSAVFDTRTRVLLTLAVPGYLYNVSGAVQPQLYGEDSPGSNCNAVLELSGALALVAGAGACVMDSVGGATALAVTVADPSAFTGGEWNMRGMQ